MVHSDAPSKFWNFYFYVNEGYLNEKAPFSYSFVEICWLLFIFCSCNWAIVMICGKNHDNIPFSFTQDFQNSIKFFFKSNSYQQTPPDYFMTGPKYLFNSSESLPTAFIFSEICNIIRKFKYISVNPVHSKCRVLHC